MPRKTPTKPRKLPQQDRSKVTVDAILEATAHILIQEGYDKASTNRIAELAGVSIGSLYQYFPNKEALVAALIEQHAHEMVMLVQTKLSPLFNLPPEIAIPALVKAAIAAHAINPTLHRVLNHEVPTGRLQHVIQAEAKISSLLQTYLEQWHDRIQPENLKLTVFILVQTVESLSHTAVIEHPEVLQDGQLEQEVSKLLLSYLLKVNSAWLVLTGGAIGLASYLLKASG